MFGSSSEPATKQPVTPLFPTFLLPSIPIPFRRRKTSTPTSSTSPSTFSHFTPASYRFSFGSGSTNSPPPSLCTSPASTTSTSASTNDSTPPSSPTSPTTYFPSFTDALCTSPTASPFSHAPQVARAVETADSTPDRLARAAPDTLRCASCSTDVAFGLQIVSKGFTGRHGRAYLVAPPSSTPSPSCPGTPVADAGSDLVNVRVGRPESRQLVTGAHVVADISCRVCGSKLGWKYVDAREAAQKYKVGKFILETARVVAVRTWEHVAPPEPASGGEVAGRARGSVDASWFAERKGGYHRRGGSVDVAEDDDDDKGVAFDSDDEDECEDIFAGTWDAVAVARKRRSRKAGPAKKGMW